MAISKNKVKVQITLHKDVNKVLEDVVNGLRKAGYEVTKSDVISDAIITFVKVCNEASIANKKGVN